MKLQKKLLKVLSISTFLATSFTSAFAHNHEINDFTIYQEKSGTFKLCVGRILKIDQETRSKFESFTSLDVLANYIKNNFYSKKYDFHTPAVIDRASQSYGTDFGISAKDLYEYLQAVYGSRSKDSADEEKAETAKAKARAAKVKIKKDADASWLDELEAQERKKAK